MMVVAEMLEAVLLLRPSFSPLLPLLFRVCTSSWQGVAAAARSVVRLLSVHSGLPALLVAGVLVAIGYRILERSARFVVEVVLVTLALAVGSELGWSRW
jgi:hypothetical protein